MLRPCDLHVLATPPAFRLSQDQTLQLFFVDHPDPQAPRYTATDSFMGRLVLEREFVQTGRVKTTPAGWLLLGCRLGQPSQSDPPDIARDVTPARNPSDRIARLKHLLDGSPPPRRGGYSNIDFVPARPCGPGRHEDHLLACTTKTLECFGVRLTLRRYSPRPVPYTGRPRLTSSRLIPTIHLSKNFRKPGRHKTVAFPKNACDRVSDGTR